MTAVRSGHLPPRDAGVDGAPPGLDPALVGRVRARLVAEGGSPQPSAQRVAAALRSEGTVLGDRALLSAVGALRDELTGAGPLEVLLADPDVTDVLVNAPDEVWVDRGAGLEPGGVRFAGEQEVERLARRLAAAAGRRLDGSVAWCDVTLPDGTRLHAVLPPVSRRGTVVSLRVPPRATWTVERLRRAGSVGAVGARLLTELMRSRTSFLVSGGTGTGKTTLLSCLLGLAPPTERILLVEDLPELAPDHPHVVALCARLPNVEGMGEVTLRDLVRQSLRMRPDRVVVGECRGPEVADLLAALNTGHEGGCGTLHANSVEAVPARVEALGMAGGLSRDAAHSQLASAVSVVVHLVRILDGRRIVRQLGVLERDRHTGLVQVAEAYAYRDGDLWPSAASGRLDRVLDRGSARD